MSRVVIRLIEDLIKLSLLIFIWVLLFIAYIEATPDSTTTSADDIVMEERKTR